MVINKKALYLFFIFPALFVSDALYGGLDYFGITLPISPGIIIRGGLFFFAVFFIVKNFEARYESLIIWSVLLLILVFPGLLIGLWFGRDPFYDLQFLLKALYLPIVAIFLAVMFDRTRVSKDEVMAYIEYAAYFLGLTLLLSQQLGIERATYGDYAFGNTGIYYAQNDFTLAFGLSLLAACYKMIFIKFSLYKLLPLLASFYACIQIGTRASLLIMLIIAIVMVIALLVSKGSESKRLSTLLAKYLGFLFVVTAIGFFLYKGLQWQTEHSYQEQKINDLQSGLLPRVALMDASYQYYISRSDIFYFLGEGADSFHRGVAQYFPSKGDRRIVEVDLIDLGGAHGVPFTFLLYAFCFFVLFGSIRRFFQERDTVWVFVSAATFLYIMYSLFVGHALTSAIPSTLMAGFFAIYLMESRAKLLGFYKKH